MALHSALTGAQLHEPKPHNASHANGGSDELSVAGLSGTLADPQDTTIAQITDATAAGKALLDDADAASQLVTLGAAPLASPALTGTPTAPTASALTNNTQIATTAYVDAAVTAGGGGGGSGVVVQVVNTQTGAVATGSTAIPLDDTIPQNTEGDQYMSLAITPTSATNKLRIDVVAMAVSSLQNWISVALFQDATAGALAATSVYQNIGGGGNSITFTHYMTAGTTSATTFKIRIGRDTSAAGTITFNGTSGGRIFGGVMASSITITEIVP